MFGCDEVQFTYVERAVFTTETLTQLRPNPKASLSSHVRKHSLPTLFLVLERQVVGTPSIRSTAECREVRRRHGAHDHRRSAPNVGRQFAFYKVKLVKPTKASVKNNGPQRADGRCDAQGAQKRRGAGWKVLFPCPCLFPNRKVSAGERESKWIDVRARPVETSLDRDR